MHTIDWKEKVFTITEYLRYRLKVTKHYENSDTLS